MKGEASSSSLSGPVMFDEPEITSSEVHVRGRGQVDGAPRLLWAIAADSNRWNRAMGFLPTRYERMSARDASSQYRERLGTTQMFWGEASWVERGEWLEGRQFRGERHFIEGPLRYGGYEVLISPSDGGAQLEFHAYHYNRMALPEALQQRMCRTYSRAIEQIVHSLGVVAEVLDHAEAELHADEPAAAITRMRVLRSPYDAHLAGPRKSPDQDTLRHALLQLRGPGVIPATRAVLEELLTERSDLELACVRPYEIARSWEVEPSGLLAAFLASVEVGLFDLVWHVICPVCRVPGDSHESLPQMGRSGHCDECGIDFGIDLASNVEAIFRANASVRTPAEIVFCAGSPLLRPHVAASVPVEPMRHREIPLPIGLTGPVLIRTLEGVEREPLHLASLTNISEVRLSASELQAITGGGRVGDPDGLRLYNDTDRDINLLLEHANYTPPIALGRDVVASPGFSERFALDAPATGGELEVGSLAVLFTDLTDSTSLYERLGDAPAFAAIQAHFVSTHDLVRENAGRVVKTMGDATMATFARPEDALRAAVAMVRTTRVDLEAHKMSLKVGLHFGPCLAVRANGRLDFFGASVNLASRLQGAAAANQIVVTRKVAMRQGVEALVASLELYREEFTTELKGIRGIRHCVALTSFPTK